MKTSRTSLTVAGALALAPALLLVAQQFLTESSREPVPPGETASGVAERTTGFLVVDRATWNLVDLANPDADLADANSDEMRWNRYKATLAFEFPEEYARQYPPTREEFERREAGIRLISQPPSLETVRASLSEEERQALDASIRAILHPGPVADLQP